MDSMEDLSSFMQTVDKFGVLLQKLLGLLEKIGQPHAGIRAAFLLSMLADTQHPGTHVSAVVVEKMDRLQALLLSFDEGGQHETSDEDREWSLRHWDILRPTLLERKRDIAERRPDGEQAAASSTDIVCVNDSQESVEQGGVQMAVLADSSTRPLTQEELEEVAYNEELERSAAEMESKADEQRWLEFRAQGLREEEDATMQEALEADNDPEGSAQKKVRVMVQVEGEGGRIVRSEIFNLVVKDGEALTYKIMVLPRNDPEVRRLRRQQAAREGNATVEPSSDVSNASADTVPVNERRQILPAPPVVSNEVLDGFMKTPEAEAYYQRWLRGDITCKMVKERSGCGLLARFFGRKTEEDEEQKMLQDVLQAEAVLVREQQREGQGLNREARMVHEGDNQTENAVKSEHGGSGTTPGHGAQTSMVAPTSWPSSALAATSTAAINLESQESAADEGVGGLWLRTMADIPAEEFSISAAENQAELAFAVAAGDVPAMPDVHAGATTHADEDRAELGGDSVEEYAGAETNTAPTGEGEQGNGVNVVEASEAGDGNAGMVATTASDNRATTSSDRFVQTDLSGWLV